MASDAVIAARRRVCAAFQVLLRNIGNFVLDICGSLAPLQQAEMQRSWPARSGKLLLLLTLARLSSHDGISDPATGRSSGRAGHRFVAWHDAPERAPMAAWLHAADQDAAAPPPRSCQASAARRRASALMRSTMARTPFERCGVRCCDSPSRSNTAPALVTRISVGVRPE
jgi:hypothetical protein